MTTIRYRRGTTAEHENFIGADGEITVDTDRNTIVVHDGVKTGGYPVFNINSGFSSGSNQSISFAQSGFHRANCKHSEDININFVDAAEVSRKDILLDLGPSYSYKIQQAFIDETINISPQDLQPSAVLLSNDGTKLFVLGGITNTLYQYSLSNPYDISSLSYDNISLSFSSNESNVTDVSFNSDGSKLYIVGNVNDSVYQYSLTSNFDISTATYDSVLFDVSTETIGPISINFNNDGTKMYVVGGNIVYSYSLTNPWDISNVTFDNINYSFSSQDNQVNGLVFNTDGSRMFIIGGSSSKLYQYILSNPFDISTASHDGFSFDVSQQDTGPNSIEFSSDGSMMYITGLQNDSIYQYELLLDNNSFYIAYENKFLNLTTVDNSPNEIAFSSDGTKLFLLGLQNVSVYQYSLGTAWDISTATYDSISFDFSTQASAPNGISFSDDGTKMIIIDTSSDSVYQYTLGTAWDISTVSYDNISFDISSQESTPVTIEFSNDGTKMYILGFSNFSIFQYSLGTAWDISTAVYENKSFLIGGMLSIDFNSDGTKLFSINQMNNVVNQYSLSTAWDISTASFDNITLSADLQSGNSRGLRFGDSGTKLYVVDNDTDRIYQYKTGVFSNVSLPIPYSIPRKAGKLSLTVFTNDSGSSYQILYDSFVED